jgi:protein-disulfide isomerase
MFTGYQCPDCQRIERELEALLKERADVSLSIKQFPMNSDCNKYFKERHHGNACYAARAAEAAGILYGNEGFWKFHRWLFEREGKFENRQILENGLKSLGLDPAGFVAAMEGPETLKRVQEDIEEAVELGIHYTPMIFINGLELRGWNAANAVRRAVEKWAEKNPPPAGPESDQPQPAAAKYVADWREQPQRRIPPRQRSYARGPSDAKVRIVLFGDYDYDMTSKLDAEIRATTKDRDDVLYEFRQAPWNKDCNADVPGNEHAQACRMAQAAEAAGALGGAEGYWRMHAWLLDHQGRYSDERLRAAAQELGFDPAALMSAMDSPEVAAAIADDVRAWKQLRLNAVPALLVNEKFVPRWSREGERIVEQILADAGGK